MDSTLGSAESISILVRNRLYRPIALRIMGYEYAQGSIELLWLSLQFLLGSLSISIGSINTSDLMWDNLSGFLGYKW
jgi:hypothetical protein